MNPTVSRGRLSWPVLGVLVRRSPRCCRCSSSEFELSVIFTKTLWLGIVAASLIFLVGVRRHGLARRRSGSTAWPA